MARGDDRDQAVGPVTHIRNDGEMNDSAGPAGDHDRRPTPIDHDRRPTPIDHERRPTPVEHEHDHVGIDSARGHGGFPHERLDAYRVALTMACTSKQVAADIPRGHRSIAAPRVRGAANVVLLPAGRAHRRPPTGERTPFAESRAECAEVAAAADLVGALDLGPPHRAPELKHPAARVAAMLTGLITRLN